MAEKAGISKAQISAVLSQVLPSLVDKLTPNGKIEGTSNSLLDQATAFLRSQTGNVE
jgi:uncharacterized protein YidB (DUF937 family)